MFPDSEYVVETGTESSNGIGVKILVRRNPETIARIEALPDARIKGVWALTEREQERGLLRQLADDIFQALVAQERRLDPALLARSKATKAAFATAFADAGLGPIFLEAIPNGYEGKDSPYQVHWPWYRVATPIGYVRIGWRKRVIEIDWASTILRAPPDPEGYAKPSLVPSGQVLFPDENVTRGETYVHAWGPEKATAYLKVLAAWPLRAED